jgi:hypothetical protein
MSIIKAEWEMDVMVVDMGLVQEEDTSNNYSMMDIRKEELELEELLMKIKCAVPECFEKGTQCDMLPSMECGGVCRGCGTACQAAALPGVLRLAGLNNNNKTAVLFEFSLKMERV